MYGNVITFFFNYHKDKPKKTKKVLIKNLFWHKDTCTVQKSKKVTLKTIKTVHKYT